MDDSWKKRMGAIKRPNNLPLPQSAEDTDRQNGVHGYEALGPEDFDDVFGGPPRSVLSRQYSVKGGFERSTCLEFQHMFRKPNRDMDLGGRSDRTLPEFRIPESKTGGLSEEEFYSDIFGNCSRSRSRSISKTNSNSKSKSNSSSILSSEELSPFRQAVNDNDDVSFSSFAAKLRPLNFSSKWFTSKKIHEVHQMADSPCDFDSFESKLRGSYSGFSQRLPSHVVATFRPNPYTNVKESTEDLQFNSPASITTSFNQDQADDTSMIQEDEEDEIMSSYVIEINPGKSREIIWESDGVDEAIAWAKQKCKVDNLEKETNKREDDDNDEEHQCPGVEEMPDVNDDPEVQIGRHGSLESPLVNILEDHMM